MIKTIFWLLGIYLLYKLIFDFILPVAKTTKTVRKQFRTMQEQMEEQMRAQQSASFNAHETATPPKTAPKAGKDDYIDFEEIK